MPERSGGISGGGLTKKHSPHPEHFFAPLEMLRPPRAGGGESAVQAVRTRR
jgi:hypothetical protein